MAISVHTNYASLVTQNTLQSTNNALTKSMEKLSTGFRINSAADDAAGLQIANRLNLQSRGLNVAMRNSQDAISMMQTAEGALDEMTNIAYRMNDLATQAANGTNTFADRSAMQSEFEQLAGELGNIFENTNFGGRSLFAGTDPSSFSSGAVSFQIGSTATETLSVDLSSNADAIGQALDAFGWGNQALAQLDANVVVESGGGDLAGTYSSYSDLLSQAEAGTGSAVADLAIANGWDETATSSGAAMGAYATSNYGGTAPTAGTTLSSVYAASSIATQSSAGGQITSQASFISELGSTRAQFGANINRLDHTITNLGNMTENLDASKGRIMDTDFASESGMMSKQQMLMQSGASMLSASKMVPQLAMSLLG
ncbi:flagellin [Vibrio chagasii]|jgi:flagellin|uniref:flagellin N-terminal helical domain-containing protein n=1 Tax=Vibrio chagasii TaxID=170679 RepID=UPI0038CDB264